MLDLNDVGPDPNCLQTDILTGKAKQAGPEGFVFEPLSAPRF